MLSMTTTQKVGWRLPMKLLVRPADLFVLLEHQGVVVMEFNSTTNHSIRPLLTVQDLAKILRFTPGSIYTLVCKKSPLLPPSCRIGGRLLWHPKVVESWIDQKAGILKTSNTFSEPQPIPKKRGRPTKGETAARKALKAAGGEK